MTEEWPDHLPADWQLAPPATDAGRHRRQQRRRAIIAWTTAVVAVGLVLLAAILAPADEEGTIHYVLPGYTMSSTQYGELETGLDEGEFLDRLDQTGLGEAETSDRYVALFPPHEDDVTCSYWQISDQVGKVARICFDEGGELVQKLERTIGEEPTGVTV